MPKTAPTKAVEANGGERKYVLLIIDPLIYLRTRLADAPLSHKELRRSYRHTMWADVVRVKRNERLPTEDAAHAWIIDEALRMLEPYINIDGDSVTLKPGVTVEDLCYRGKPIPLREPDIKLHLDHPFDKGMVKGVFAENIREKGPDDLDELRESMKTFGWIDYHPAIVDEFDVVIVGHRRLKVAAELGIEPQIVKLDFGMGDEADVKRLKLAIGSNLGGKPFTPKDRRKIAKRLYGEEGWSLERIAELLEVSSMQISRDTEGVVPATHKRKETRGRKKKRALTGLQQRAIKAAITIQGRGEEVTEKKIMKEAGVANTPAQHAMTVAKMLPDDDDPIRKWLHERAAVASIPMLRAEAETLIKDFREFLDRQY